MLGVGALSLEAEAAISLDCGVEGAVRRERGEQERKSEVQVGMVIADYDDGRSPPQPWKLFLDCHGKGQAWIHAIYCQGCT